LIPPNQNITGEFNSSKLKSLLLFVIMGIKNMIHAHLLLQIIFRSAVIEKRRYEQFDASKTTVIKRNMMSMANTITIMWLYTRSTYKTSSKWLLLWCVISIIGKFSIIRGCHGSMTMIFSMAALYHVARLCSRRGLHGGVRTTASPIASIRVASCAICAVNVA
jgi:hypothetical protein